MYRNEDAAAVAEFIRSNGITHCPTACLVPTQASVPFADKVALWRHAQRREERRLERLRNSADSRLAMIAGLHGNRPAH
jgi:hypothetical protein